MTVWVAQKTSLYSLVATRHCAQKLQKTETTVRVAEAVWEDIQQDLPQLPLSIANELQALKDNGQVQAMIASRDRVRAIYQRFEGRVNLRLCTLYALLDVTAGLLLTDSVQVLRASANVPEISHRTGVSVAREWLTNTPDALSATEYVERASQLFMLTPQHPDAEWWFTHLQSSG